jgi:hypothetical protein
VLQPVCARALGSEADVVFDHDRHARERELPAVFDWQCVDRGGVREGKISETIDAAVE